MTALRQGTLNGWEALTLESERLRVTVLPGKGAELHELVDRGSGVDALFHAPWGLAGPDDPPREGSMGPEFGFLHRYAGGWQELFPSGNDPCTYAGRPIPFHGEVATLPWSWEALGDGALRLAVRCQSTPFRLERTMRLADDAPALRLEETVVNEGEAPAHFTWGHHCVVGPPLLEAGCRLDAPAGTIVTIPEPWEDTARLEPGQRSAWPHGRLRGGGTVDLSQVPGPEAHSHDDVYLTDLTAGYVAVENPRLGLRFRLDFDDALFRWLIAWQPYGGAEALPLAGSYALGIEPWVTRLDLEHAVAAGEAVELAPGARYETRLTASFSSLGA